MARRTGRILAADIDTAPMRKLTEPGDEPDSHRRAARGLAGQAGGQVLAGCRVHGERPIAYPQHSSRARPRQQRAVRSDPQATATPWTHAKQGTLQSPRTQAAELLSPPTQTPVPRHQQPLPVDEIKPSVTGNYRVTAQNRGTTPATCPRLFHVRRLRQGQVYANAFSRRSRVIAGEVDTGRLDRYPVTLNPSSGTWSETILHRSRGKGTHAITDPGIIGNPRDVQGPVSAAPFAQTRRQPLPRGRTPTQGPFNLPRTPATEAALPRPAHERFRGRCEPVRPAEQAGRHQGPAHGLREGHRGPPRVDQEGQAKGTGHPALRDPRRLNDRQAATPGPPEAGDGGRPKPRWT